MNVKAFDSALDFVPAKAAKGGMWSVVGSWFTSIREGIRLASDYKLLTSHGVAPDVAVRRVFDTIQR